MKKKRQRFERSRRLSGRKQFARVFAGRCSASNRHLVVYVVANGLDCARLGLSVGRKVGGAVERNRIKRLVREAFRLNVERVAPGYDYVCVARPNPRPTLADYEAALANVGRRAILRYESSKGAGR